MYIIAKYYLVNELINQYGSFWQFIYQIEIMFWLIQCEYSYLS